MEAPDPLPCAGAGRRVRVLRVAAALLALGILAGCTGPGAVMRQFGVVGSFSEDCARPIAAGGARGIYDVSGAGYPTFIAINRYGTFGSKIVRADQIGPDRLILYIDRPGGAWDEIDLQKKDNGFLTTRMVSHKPNEPRPLVAIGSDRYAAPAGDGLFVQKCAD